jgi:hypothetical protein
MQAITPAAIPIALEISAVHVGLIIIITKQV